MGRIHSQVLENPRSQTWGLHSCMFGHNSGFIMACTSLLVDVSLSPTSDVSRPLIGQLARVYDLVCRGKSCMSG